MKFSVDKSKMRDVGGRYVTQGLFYDFNYDDSNAVYVLHWEDKTVGEVVYPSLKRLFLEMEDLTEYNFANTYLCNWEHWQKMNGNKILREQFDKWREELELKLRAKNAKHLLKLASEGNFAAAKWFANKEWSEAKRGRPSKEEKEARLKEEAKLEKEISEDASRVVDFLSRKEKAGG